MNNTKICNLETDFGKLELHYTENIEDFCEIVFTPKEDILPIIELSMCIALNHSSDLMVCPIIKNSTDDRPFFAYLNTEFLSMETPNIALDIIDSVTLFEYARIIREALKWREFWKTIS